MSHTDLLFLDFEACALGPSSWPIEIGAAWIEEGKVRPASRLIRPHPSWPRDAWSTGSPTPSSSAPRLPRRWHAGRPV